MIFPNNSIVVATRHRGDNIKTTRLFPGANLVVEPHDAGNYSGIVHVLPEDNRGLAHTREVILQAATGNVLMLDDDVMSIGKFRGKKKDFLYYDHALAESPQEMADAVFRHLTLGYAMVGIMYSSKPTLQSRRIWCVFGLNASLLKKHNIHYDTTMPCLSDYDMQLRIMEARLPVAILSQYCYRCAPYAGYPGGQNDGLRTEVTRRVGLEKFLSHHPRTTSMDMKDGRMEARIAWKKAGHVKIV